MVKCLSEENKAIILWRGNPLLVPLRHVRPHVGFIWLLAQLTYWQTLSSTMTLDSTSSTNTQLPQILSQIMDSIEDHVVGQIYTFGRQ